MKPTIIFIHGMFLTGKSWEKWVPFFEERGARCLAPSWPFHVADPAALRTTVPDGLGKLELNTLTEMFANLAQREDQKPILIGHSLGGLIAQLLVARGLASAAVCISSVAPNAMISADWGFLKNSTQIANPLKGDDPFIMTEEGFHDSFCNTMTAEENAQAYRRYVVNESRNVLRDAMGKAGKIDLERPHAPLLFLTAQEDQIIPDKLNKKNAEAYSDAGSVTDFHEFSRRGHFICGQAGWESVADYAAVWLEHRGEATATLGHSASVTSRG